MCLYYYREEMETKVFFFVLSVHLAVTLAQVSDDEVQYYKDGIEKLEDQSISWVFPENSDEYLAGNRPTRDCHYDGSYDFVIAGGGAAGSVLANRLSEIHHWKIQVIDAGSFEDKIVDVPGMASLLRTTDYNWGYSTTSQRYFTAFENRSLQFPIGKCLGGSSVINYMMYVRGNRNDFEQWAALGNPGWSYDEVLPYFKISERATMQNVSSKYHGFDGPVNVESIRYFNEMAEGFLNGQEQLGRKILDYNGENQMGFSRLQSLELNGTRVSGMNAYIAPVMDRRNLRLTTDALVLKILINPFNKQAWGVKYLKNGTCFYSRATKEVILSAGAMNSPQLLMLSGIGPQKHLEEHNINVIKNLPVGNNLWNHIAFTSHMYQTNNTLPNPSLTEQIQDYLQGEGPLTAVSGIQALGFVNTKNTSATYPNLEYVFQTKTPNPEPYIFYKNTFRYTEEAYKNVLVKQENVTGYTFFIVLLHSKSRGTIRLQSNSPFDFPLIDPNYFTEDDDIETILSGLKDMQRHSETVAMKKFGPRLINVTLPICESFEQGSDDFWRCMIKNLADTIHHYGGTCKMGPREDDTAVVDNELRVHGVRNLRVADCSVMPTTSSGHTNAVAYMIGEKASDIIKQYYRRKIKMNPHGM